MLLEFSITPCALPDIHVVALQGEMDIVSADDLADTLVGVASPTVVVDLSAVTFMDCSGIAALEEARDRIRRAGLGQLVLARPGPMVRRTLEIVGLESWITEWPADCA